MEATMSSGGRTAILASTWRLKTGHPGRGGRGDSAATPLEQCEELNRYEQWGGGYIGSLRPAWRACPARAAARAGPRISKAVVEGRVLPHHLISAVDAANGLAPRGDRPVGIPNVDLTIHMFRAPVSAWVGLDTNVEFAGHVA
ncbi:hypothetical protein QJS66_17285 [Kocuria rhizophila]|nr:hypothetical protein QJS66_17285 [Kocuria rhizophila]